MAPTRRARVAARSSPVVPRRRPHGYCPPGVGIGGVFVNGRGAESVFDFRPDPSPLPGVPTSWHRSRSSAWKPREHQLLHAVILGVLPTSWQAVSPDQSNDERSARAGMGACWKPHLSPRHRRPGDSPSASARGTAATTKRCARSACRHSPSVIEGREHALEVAVLAGERTTIHRRGGSRLRNHFERCINQGGSRPPKGGVGGNHFPASDRKGWFRGGSRFGNHLRGVS